MTVHSPSIEPRKQPRQARSVVTVDAILEAAALILQERGLPTLNTNDVARRAGVSIGSLYQYFPTKEAILAEIIRRKRLSLLKGLSEAREASQGAPFPTTVRNLVEVTIRHQTNKQNFARALDYAYAMLPIQQETDALNRKIIAVICDALEGLDLKDSQEAAIDVVAIVRGMVEAAGLRGETDRSALAERICRAVHGYILAEPVEESD